MSEASARLFHLHGVSAVFHCFFSRFEFSVPMQALKSTPKCFNISYFLKM